MPVGVYPRKTLRERLLSRLIIDPSGCLLWTGGRNDQGYGQISIGDGTGRNMYIHRLMYEWFIGPIPDGLHIDHLCRVRHCGSPAHLEAVTCRENMLRGVSIGARVSQQAHCDRGHEYTPENTYLRTDRYGSRQCRTCKAERSRRYYYASKARDIIGCPDCGQDLTEEAFAYYCESCQREFSYAQVAPTIGDLDDDR